VTRIRSVLRFMLYLRVKTGVLESWRTGALGF
jgi:hypothetical protein